MRPAPARTKAAAFDAVTPPAAAISGGRAFGRAKAATS
jgi:hypothetical protein